MMRIESAIARAKENGKNVTKKEIAARLWPNSSETTQAVNMNNVCNGRTARIEPAWINIICEMTGCSANYLLGIDE